MRRLLAVMGAVLLGGWWPQAALAEPHRPARSTYVVVLRDGAGSPGEVGREHAAAHGGRVTSVYEHALRGYAAELTEEAAARIARDRRVESIGPDRVASVAAQGLPTGVDRASEPAVEKFTNHGVGLDGVDDLRVDADIAIIDTAVDARHPDLDVLSSIDCTSGSCVAGTGVDGNGHGTHVAGSAAALDNDFGVVGVAPGARIWSVKVLNDSGTGSLSWILAGVDWVTARAAQIEVANMSLGCACNPTDPAVTALLNGISSSVAAGVTYTAAAGNLATNASDYIPASNPDVITVSALIDFDGVSGGVGLPTCRSEIDDTLVDFSNDGPAVELTAPGGCVFSTWPNASYHTLSGTSMAAPHVAGAAALLASQPAYRGQPASIRETLVASGNFGWTDDSGDGVQEPLLDVTGSTPVLVAPRQVITASVANLWHHEVDDGTTSTAAFTITLSAPPGPGEVLTLKAATANSTATAPADYTSLASTTVTFTEGETAETVEITINGDALAEGDEVFLLNLSAPTAGLVLADTQASATIVDNEGQLFASVEDLTVPEPASGTTAVTATVALSAPATHSVKVKVVTANSAATAGSDYTAVPSTTLTFLAGEQTKPVTIDVHGDSAYEGNESFLVKLSGPTGGLVLSDASATVTIVDAQGPLIATVADVVVAEGDDGTTPATFTITLSAAPVTGQVVSLKVATGAGTAQADADYTPLGSTTVSFAAGEYQKTVAVDVLGDLIVESHETFVLNLTSPTGGLGVADGQATGTIPGDD